MVQIVDLVGNGSDSGFGRELGWVSNTLLGCRI